MAEKIVIDAGHNGLTDPGAVYNGRRESDDVLSLAQAVGDLLMQNGYEVEYTRTGNINQSVVQKAQFANQTGADLFVSLHRNMASYPGQYNGVQTLLYDLSGLKQVMAENINQNLENVGYRNINVEARPDLAVLRRTQMPALLVEVGFIDSTIDNQLFDTRFDQTAQAIADGIIDTLNAAHMEERPVMPGTGNSRPLYRVQVGAFYNLQNAIDLEQELKRLGYNTWIVTV
ncbi:MAG: N-acetylmuramoyl-L-alanine amidase [Lachnospiraceae bacterium]|nr:N-acetylmuramoyl-L-alanine amidase [Lachnospiraceae bacterium]